MGLPKPQNLYSPGNKANTKEYRDGWERIFGKKKKEEKKEESEEQQEEEPDKPIVKVPLIPRKYWYVGRDIYVDQVNENFEVVDNEEL